jgi:hypothetical protein
MFQAQPASLPTRQLRDVALPPIVIRPGQHTFWALLAVQLVVVLAALVWSIDTLVPPGRVALADGDNRQHVVAAVYSRLNQQTPDRLLSVAPGVLARESSLRGFELNGSTYYYQLAGEQGFDPLSRGSVSHEQVEVVYRAANAGRTLLIYTMAQP